jgi:hypothetical protein
MKLQDADPHGFNARDTAHGLDMRDWDYEDEPRDQVEFSTLIEQ